MRRILTLVLFGSLISLLQAQTTELLISEYVEGWSNNKALEIYNPTEFTMDLSEFP